MFEVWWHLRKFWWVTKIVRTTNGFALTDFFAKQTKFRVVRTGPKPLYFKNYLASGIINIHDLRFDLNITDSFGYFSNEIYKINFLQWAGLRYSIPLHLKTDNVTVSTDPPSFSIENNIFDVTVKRSKDYYSLLVSEKAKPPNIIPKLQNDFNFTTDQIKQIFALPHLVALESYVKAFQYKVINSILYTNTKLFKIGYKTDDLCTFCNVQSETLSHLFYDCSHLAPFIESTANSPFYAKHFIWNFRETMPFI